MELHGKGFVARLHEAAKPQKRVTKVSLFVLFGGFVAPSFTKTKLSGFVFARGSPSASGEKNYFRQLRRRILTPITLHALIPDSRT